VKLLHAITAQRVHDKREKTDQYGATTRKRTREQGEEEKAEAAAALLLDRPRFKEKRAVKGGGWGMKWGVVPM
jgi:hypothetical protein